MCPGVYLLELQYGMDLNIPSIHHPYTISSTAWFCLQTEQQEPSQLQQPTSLLQDNGKPSREAQPGQNRARSIDPIDRKLPGGDRGEEEEAGKRM